MTTFGSCVDVSSPERNAWTILSAVSGLLKEGLSFDDISEVKNISLHFCVGGKSMYLLSSSSGFDVEDESNDVA